MCIRDTVYTGGTTSATEANRASFAISPSGSIAYDAQTGDYNVKMCIRDRYA